MINLPKPDRPYIDGLAKHLFQSIATFTREFSGPDPSVLDTFVGINCFYSSIIAYVEQMDAITREEADERRKALLHMLTTALDSIGYSHLASPPSSPTSPDPMIGRHVTIIGTEDNGLLWSNGLVCEVIDVIAPPEDDVVYLVRLANGSLGELMNGDFELVEIGENHE